MRISILLLLFTVLSACFACPIFFLDEYEDEGYDDGLSIKSRISKVNCIKQLQHSSAYHHWASKIAEITNDKISSSSKMWDLKEKLGRNYDTQLTVALVYGLDVCFEVLVDAGAKVWKLLESDLENFLHLGNCSAPILDSMVNNHNVAVTPKLLYKAALTAGDKCFEIVVKGIRDIDEKTSYGYSTLVLAAKDGNTHAVQRLAQAGAAVMNTPALLYASMQKDLELINYLISAGASPHYRLEDGSSALHQACLNNAVDIVDSLLRAGATVNTADNDGKTPLYIAAKLGSYPMIERLLTENADVNLVDKAGVSPAMLAAKLGKADILTLLIAKGANVNAVRTDGSSAVYVAARNKHEHIIKILIDNGAQVKTATRKDGWSPVHVAAYRGCSGCLRHLLQQQPVLDARTTDGDFPVQLSARWGHKKCTERLITAGSEAPKACLLTLYGYC